MVFVTIALCCSLTSSTAGDEAAIVRQSKVVTVGGTHIDTSAPPTGLVVRPDLGLVCVEPLDGQLLYTSKTHLFEAHGTITPGGDYLVMFPDGGRTWSEPRFVFANALAETDRNAFFNYQCSYMDCFVDGKVLHLILPHRWKRVLHLTLPEDALRRLPTKTEIKKSADAGR
jgi:hypothetical protein